VHCLGSEQCLKRHNSHPNPFSTGESNTSKNNFFKEIELGKPDSKKLKISDLSSEESRQVFRQFEQIRGLPS